MLVCRYHVQPFLRRDDEARLLAPPLVQPFRFLSFTLTLCLVVQHWGAATNPARRHMHVYNTRKLRQECAREELWRAKKNNIVIRSACFCSTSASNFLGEHQNPLVKLDSTRDMDVKRGRKDTGRSQMTGIFTCGCLQILLAVRRAGA